MLTYTIYFTPSEIHRDLNWDDVRKCDEIPHGMVEQVLDDLICWHSVPFNGLEKVLEFCSEYFHLSTVELCRTYEMTYRSYAQDFELGRIETHFPYSIRG